jgi:hypothetical protein
MSFRIRCGACGSVHYAGDSHKCAARAVKNAEPVKNAPHVDVKNSSTSTARTAKWREANREKSRQYMCAYMRERRAK